MRKRILVVSIDGAPPATVRRGNYFAAPRIFGSSDTGVHDLTSVYPSSTASAHASMLTGKLPRSHGIVANGFWCDEPVLEIRARASNPLASFHPYEHSSLLTSSLLDWCRSAGLSTAAAQFPQTISRSVSATGPGYYCLYSAPRTISIPLLPNRFIGEIVLDYFGLPVSLVAHLAPSGVILRCGATVLDLSAKAPARLNVEIEPGLLSMPITLVNVTLDEIFLVISKASLILHPNSLNTEVFATNGPSAAEPSYRDSEGREFVEAPTSTWVAETASRMVGKHDPDVFFLRFNQTDHVQEHLYWQQQHGTATESRDADEQIQATYAAVAADLASVIRSMGAGTQVVMFSDHGIDWVDSHVRPNVLLDELGLGDRMVFQGDSTCAYLYVDGAVSAEEQHKLGGALESMAPGLRVRTEHEVRELGLPVRSRRTGLLVATCGRHTEFLYSGSPAWQHVRSASHGFHPELPEMSGFFRAFGPHRLTGDLPKSILEVGSFIKALCRRTMSAEG